MDYEKKRKEEVVRATQLWEYGDITRENLEYIFPELAESEDEKVKRIIHSISNKISFHLHDIFTEEEFQCFDAWSNAWLKKQDKSKWTDEDEENMQHCCGAVAAADYYTMEDKEEMANWLVSLKQRMEVKQGKRPLIEERPPEESLGISPEEYADIVNECIYGEQKPVDKQEPASSAKTCENDTLLDLLNKMPPFITVDGVDYYFVMKKTSFYTAYYKAIGEEGSGNAIFWATAFSPIDLLTEMLEHLKKKGLLE